MKNALLVVGIGALILAGGWYFASKASLRNADGAQPAAQIVPENGNTDEKTVIEEQGAAIGDENLVTFQCEGGKSITAVFERDIVGVTLSDGRQITLRQAESGSGIRYFSNDQKIEFSGKGNEAFLVENGETVYENCLAES